MTGLAGRAGLPATVVVGDRWSAHHVPTAQLTLGGACVITRTGGLPTFNELTGRTVIPDRAVIYDGPFRLVRLGTEAHQTPTADRDVTARGYQLTVTADAPEILVDDQAQISDCPDDLLAVGTLLRVRDVHLASQRWQRDLVCELVENTSR